MKKLFSLLFAAGISVTMIAQTVTIEARGERNGSILVDGQTYGVSPDVLSNNNANLPIVITGLSLGQHRIQVMRTERNGTTYSPGMSATFTLRSGYDMDVVVNPNGSIQLSEKRSVGIGSGGAMSDADFAVLLRKVRNERNQARRITLIRNSFDNINSFTTSQVYDLLSTITSQSQRLSLAKLGYKNVVDGENYDDLNTLIRGKARRDDLASFVVDFNIDHPGHVGGTGNMAMSSAEFERIYREAQAQYSSSTRMTFLSTRVFGPADYYFSTDQAHRLISLMSTESDRLQLAKEAYDNLANPSSYQDLDNLFTYQSSRNELANYVNNRGTGNPRVPMTSTRFNQIFLEVRQQWSASERVNMMEEAFENVNNYFTSTQATQLIALAGAESDRLRLAKMSWDKVTDQSNYRLYYDVLQSTASRNDFNSFINSGAAYLPVTTPMSDASYNSIYDRISNSWGLGVKMNLLTEVFEDPLNYFTVAQAEKLIRLVSAEYNRLALAKSSYDNIVDKENFSQLNDIFDSQASVNELNAYVNSYSYNR